MAVTLGDLGVGAGYADCGDTCVLECIGCCDSNSGAVRAENDGYAFGNDLGCCGNSLLGIGLVIAVNELYLVFHAADGDGGAYGIGIFHAKDLLLAACAVCAGLRLIDADLDDLLIRAAAACAKCEHHDECEDKCYDFLHFGFLLIILSTSQLLSARGEHLSFC